MANNRGDKDDAVLPSKSNVMLKEKAKMFHGCSGSNSKIFESDAYHTAFAAAASFHQLLMSPLTQAFFLPFLSPSFGCSPDFSSYLTTFEHQLQQQHQQPPVQHQTPFYSTQSNRSTSESCETEYDHNRSGIQKSSPTLATGRRNLKSEKVTPQENHRRAQRREKNRQAAAKCRQKRHDCIALLEVKLRELEEERTEAEHQLCKLQSEVVQLSEVLKLHNTECRFSHLSHVHAKQSSWSIPSRAVASPVRAQEQACLRPNNLTLPTVEAASSRTTLSTPGLTTPSCPVSSSPLWESNASLGLTPLLSGLETPFLSFLESNVQMIT